MRKILLKILLIIFIFSSFAQISSADTSTPIKILLVPGHDNEVWGAQYGNVKEAAMNLAVASRIYNILSKDKRYEVHITRDTNGYTKEFADYFTSNAGSIAAFEKNAKTERHSDIANGDFIEKENVPHHEVSSEVALKLYGINKWASENKMDAVIHIHFNDYPRPNKWMVGKYTGFTVYIPETQMVNSFASDVLGTNIFLELKKLYHTSTYDKEKGGFIPDQKLIALGSNGTLAPSVRSVLIEYGYIYEKKFRNYTTRHQAYNNMARLTTQGINNYFLK